jgi:hypothetical protein
VHEEVTFRNADYSYVVYWSLDRLDESRPVTGGVTILKGETYVADLTCSAGTVGESFGPVLSEALRAIGLCWDFNTHKWSSGSCN